MIKEKLKENQELGEECGLQYKYGGQLFWKETLEKGLEGSKANEDCILEQNQCKGPKAGMCQETAWRQVEYPAGPSKESLQKKREGINCSWLIQ